MSPTTTRSDTGISGALLPAALVLLAWGHWVSGWSIIDRCSQEIGSDDRCAATERLVSIGVVGSLVLGVLAFAALRRAEHRTTLALVLTWLAVGGSLVLLLVLRLD